MTRPSVRVVEISKDRDGQRLDNFLLNELKGVPKTLVYRIIRKGQVRVNGGRCKPMRKLKSGDLVRIPPVRTGDRADVNVPEWAREQLLAAILYKDDDLLVIDKPAGMAVHAGSGLSWGVIDVLRQVWPDEYFELAHRLDRETSGCLLIARNGNALRHFSEQFREGTVKKTYLCLADGRLPEATVRLDAPLKRFVTGERRIARVDKDGKSAISHFHLLDFFSTPATGSSFMKVNILTGRTHQIRAHARHLGLPLAGDSIYGDSEGLKRWKALGLNRLFLHANQVELVGLNQQAIEVSSPLPKELRAVLDRLGG